MPHNLFRALVFLCLSGTFSQVIGAAARGQPASRESLEAMLTQVPEVDLYGDYAAKSKAQLAAAASDIARQNADGHDAFVRTLIKERGDLAGLPFMMGKDCTLSIDQARVLAEASSRTRAALSEAPRFGKSRDKVEASALSGMDPITYAFWLGLGPVSADRVSALHQITCVEKSDFRMAMIKRVQDVSGPRASGSLVKMALYDLDADVRAEALHALQDRPKDEYRAEVLKAFRHPWAPVARNAAAAVIALKMKEIIPDLKVLLKQPDPAAPFVVKTDDGKAKTMVRELVRVNHHRNCMLCHPPVGDAALRDLASLPIGPVTSMDQELPSSSTTVYYSPRPGIILVRADITYLRQDFSVQLKVKKPGNWPARQRFDFFVRVRETTPSELQERRTLEETSLHTQAVSDALQGLAGRASPLE